MKVEQKDLGKSQVELTVELSYEEFAPYISKGAQKVGAEVKIDGFRPGKAPLEAVKQKVGEMTILEEAARLAINKTIDEVIKNNLTGDPVGQPQVNIIKLAPQNPLEYKIVVAMLPLVEIGNYKEAKVKKEKIDISDMAVEKMLNDLREMRVEEVLVEREIKNGDKVTADVKLFLDKVPVDGGQGNGVAMVIGQEIFIPGFDKQLIGTKKNDLLEFSLPYPIDHFQKNLAGKLVEFTVNIKDVYERKLSELNDKFAASFGLKKIEELKTNIKKSLEDEKKHEVEQKVEAAILDKIIEKTKFGDLPEILIENESRNILGEMEHDVKNRGGKFEDYLSSINKTRDQLVLDLLPNAIKRVKAALIIREIAKQEKIEVSEVEIDKKIEELIKQYKGYEKVETRVKDPSYRSYLYSMLVNQKVAEKLMDWNIEK